MLVTLCFSVIYYTLGDKELFELTLALSGGYIIALILFRQQKITLAIHLIAFASSTAIIYASLVYPGAIIWIPATALIFFLTLNSAAIIWTLYIFVGTCFSLMIDSSRMQPIYPLAEALNIIFALAAVIVVCLLFINRLNKQHQELVEQSEQAIHEHAKLERAESERQLSIGVAHLINNEMQVINNYSYLLLQELKDPRQQKMLESIYDYSLKAGGHATQLLHFANSSNIELMPTNIRQTILDWKDELMQQEGYPEHIQLHMNPGDNEIICNANRETLFEMLYEIWSNAVEACDEKGLVHIRLEENNTGNATITVADNGHGMNKETLQKVFKPFYSTRFTGRGLGLASINGIMNAHLGMVKVDSEENKGTVVTLTLPILHTTAQEQEDDAEAFGDSCPQT